MKHKYNGSYFPEQIQATVSSIRKSIFFLLLYVDPKTKNEYSSINVQAAFVGLQHKLSGLNHILLNPPIEIIETMSLLEEALMELNKGESFNWATYRKLILDAGAKISYVKDGD